MLVRGQHVPRTSGRWVVWNPDWPEGHGEYLRRCPGCPVCDPDERQRFYDAGILDVDAMAQVYLAEVALVGWPHGPPRKV
jgi:hypothetical protein